MHCYTSTFNGLTRGIAFVQEPEGGTVYLGEEGPRRHRLKVPLCRKTPPQRDAQEQTGYVERRVRDVMPIEAFRAREGRPPVKHLVLARSNGKDVRVLVRIKTTAAFTPYTQGRWETVDGTPEELARGWGAHGAGGVMGTWDDGLVVMAPGDTLRVHPEGLSVPYLLQLTVDGLEQTKDEVPRT